MLFNFWKPFPKFIPKKRGWYICSIRYGEERNQAYVMDLFWDDNTQMWKDNRRINVFETYDVYGYGLDEDNKPAKIKLYKDSMCTRIDVIAFKNCPKIYK